MILLYLVVVITNFKSMTIIAPQHTLKTLFSIYSLSQPTKRLELMQFVTTRLMIYGEAVLETFALVILGTVAEENQMDTHTLIQ